MTPKKKMTREKTIVAAILILLLTHVVIHCVHYSDTLKGKLGPDGITLMDSSTGGQFYGGMQVSPSTNTGIFDVIEGGVKEAFLHPFDLNGLVLSHCVTPLLLTYALAGVAALFRKTERDAHRQDAAGKEYGSSAWNTDIKGFLKEFADI